MLSMLLMLSKGVNNGKNNFMGPSNYGCLHTLRGFYTKPPFRRLGIFFEISN
jgi:hypothetical protein